MSETERKSDGLAGRFVQSVRRFSRTWSKSICGDHPTVGWNARQSELVAFKWPAWQIEL